MDFLTVVLIGSQLVFTLIATTYFYTSLKTMSSSKKTTSLDSIKEYDNLQQMRQIKLTLPLSEKTRPQTIDEVIGQDKGIKALKAALCGENPQHVLIYGPPGIGKTATARLILEEAKKTTNSPFKDNAPFIEIDATTLQYDERSIADPLLGSVHDPIYQGAGAYGQAGIPQPKPGSVTKAHGGILFIDEIGELSTMQLNKLLKVLEDRKVFLNSSYYSKENVNNTKYISDVFENGLPADFRLIGATTRSPEEIPPALRSRCCEIFFNSLTTDQIKTIAVNCITKVGFSYEDDIIDVIKNYVVNGRDVVKIIQNAISYAYLDNRTLIKLEDVEEIIENGQFSPKITKTYTDKKRKGIINGLAVSGNMEGMVLEIEVESEKADGKGLLNITGIIEEEQFKTSSGYLKRKSTAKGSIENISTVLNKYFQNNLEHYSIHVNFPGSIPIDGPSAGCAILCAIYSSIKGYYIKENIAVTGELGIKGQVLPVGGVTSKIEAAVNAGLKKVYIPKANYQKHYKNLNIEVIPVSNVFQLTYLIFNDSQENVVALNEYNKLDTIFENV